MSFETFLDLFWLQKPTVLPDSSAVVWNVPQYSSPSSFPIALAHDPTLHSSPLISGLCFQSCLEFFRYSFFNNQELLRMLDGSSESWSILQSADRSLVAPCHTVAKLCHHHGLWKPQLQYPCPSGPFKAHPFWLNTCFSSITGIKWRGSHFVTVSVSMLGFPRNCWLSPFLLHSGGFGLRSLCAVVLSASQGLRT